MGIKVIVTGVTGMVGEGVLMECLAHPDVEQALVINRRPCGVAHPKLKEIIHKDFFDITPIASELTGYDGCFFCLGVSSIGLKEKEYTHLTYDLTTHVAGILAPQNTGMVFCYVSGAGTDGTEQGKSMWARVKGRTENHLLSLPFRKAYMFRPGFMKATEGQKNTPKLYKAFAWLYPFLRAAFPRFACTLQEVGIAMINTVTKGYDKPVLEVADIVALAKK